MKKLLYIICAGVIAFMAVSCDKKAVFDPAKITAPVMGTTSVSAAGVTVNYTPAEYNLDFNKEMGLTHTLALVKAGEQTVSYIIKSNDTGSTLSATAENISAAVARYGFEDGQKVDIEIVVRASVQDPTKDNGKNGYVDSENTLAVPNFTVIAPKSGEELEYWADFSGYTEASKWSVIGSIASTGNSWGNDEPMVTKDNWHVCIGLTLATSDQFKFRFDGSWDVNIGAEGDTEPAVVALGVEYTGKGGGKNLAVPADGVYDLYVYTEDNVPENAKYKIVKHIENPYKGWTDSAEWAVIGSIASTGNSWGNDEPMISNGTWWVCRNLVLSSSDQFKFRKDGSWDVNIGAEGDTEPFVVTLKTQFNGKGGGKNLGVSKDGTYDLLVKPGASPDESVYEIVVAGTVPVLD